MPGWPQPVRLRVQLRRSGMPLECVQVVITVPPDHQREKLPVKEALFLTLTQSLADCMHTRADCPTSGGLGCCRR